ncbi:MAG: SDR family NAD(P)-dependent oxidoreductase [Chloroflexi bacterium]|nr:SDR family NAD(P)-dependent oxidoreductase [Chloroflexota bacterium]
MKVVITGGAGFIGCNAAMRLAELGHEVVIFDNLSRPGSERNLAWLQGQHKVLFVRGDVRDSSDVESFFAGHKDADAVLHLAAQVAVTTSVTDPRHDFDVNAFGTFNVLEAVRKSGGNPVFVFSSTNKVYGEMLEAQVELRDGRYRYAALPCGVGEAQPLDFHSPYGCSKGSADQYVRDYHRIYGMRTVVLRKSCIYGYRQFGIEDQGWVAWFAIAAMQGRPITIYGDGRQVRDLLFIDDLVNLYLAVIDRAEMAQGQVFNIGGGPAFQLSVLEALGLLERLSGKKLNLSYDDWRPGDQKVYVSDTSKARRVLGWRPTVPPEEGIERLYRWVEGNRELFGK